MLVTTYEAIKNRAGCTVLLVGSRMRGTHRPNSDHDYLCIFDDDKEQSRTRITVGRANYSITTVSRFQRRLNRNDLHAIEIYLKYPEIRRRYSCGISDEKIERKRESLNRFTAAKAGLISRIGGDPRKTLDYISHTNDLCDQIRAMRISGALETQSEEPVDIAVLSRIPGPCTEPKTDCIHKGQELRREQCQSCNGTVQIKVFACSLHTECTLQKQVNQIQTCANCPDKEV